MTLPDRRPACWIEDVPNPKQIGHLKYDIDSLKVGDQLILFDTVTGWNRAQASALNSKFNKQRYGGKRRFTWNIIDGKIVLIRLRKNAPNFKHKNRGISDVFRINPDMKVIGALAKGETYLFKGAYSTKSEQNVIHNKMWYYVRTDRGKGKKFKVNKQPKGMLVTRIK